ncbi:LOW QUALITY PROTEIN: uncharacterized protein LOC117316747 [Pecten maximus]|uniref:LOW QUALITY PROTEIN: uncharacterized protein LOC117316747 n=1 Tax=Pecten maximus TaxID=6579 RepID=UPI001458CB0F|nr:LOW QUALITY PROTEIN: uncharacterized protein LOC117316747 [Pecten maximus]
MAVSVSLDLRDIRKTQSRVKCLIQVKEVNNVQQYPLRRRPLPPGFCYVCSRLDPNGRHKVPNGYLFSKGFFSYCEHMQPPRPPYPTFIEDDKDIDIPVLPLEHLANKSPGQPPGNQNVNLSVSVTIKNKNSPSPDQKYSKKYFDTAVLNGVDDNDYDYYEDDRYRLPPVFDKDSPENGKHILHASDKTFAEAGSYNDEIHTYLSDDDFKVPHLPSLSNGRNMTSYHDEYKHDPSSTSPGRSTKVRHVVKKKKTKREIEKPLKSQIDDVPQHNDEYDEDEEGVLKYNHRDEFSSLPNEGLEMAPSRDNSKLNSGMTEMSSAAPDVSSGGMEVSFGDRRRSLHENPPSMTIQKIGSPEHWCECTDTDLVTLKCDECAAIGGHENWCTYARSGSRHGKCPKCGKNVRKTKALSSQDVKTDIKRKLSFTRRMSRMTTKSDDLTCQGNVLSATHPLRQSRQRVLHVRFEDDKDGTHAEKHVDRLRSKTVTDEDYKKYDKAYQDFVYNREGWTEQSDYSDEEEFDDFPPKVHPRVDPNIHRDAYYRAIAARSLEKLKKMDEVDEKFAADRISKPHVFSYFKLRPHQKNALPGGPDNIGILPSESANVRPRKAMKHIFGKIKVDDFYPGGKRNKSQVSVSYSKDKNKQTMPINKWTRGGLNG